jgi:hypothetical protein
MYCGRGAEIPDQLALQRLKARQQRLERNREAACSRCPRTGQEGLAA